ncbi:metallophosphoesterase family protein [Marinobacter azerbaijanicus]|uniref:metallophosphoesterase family protein n=1 Tax=Marinobacter azerbaijanicus TaxID=3050455 RepID=UPI003BF51DC8
MRPEALEVLKGSDLILHAGDVGRDEVLDALEEIAGHSHKPRNEWIGDVLYFNPGGAGPRRLTPAEVTAVLKPSVETG